MFRIFGSGFGGLGFSVVAFRVEDLGFGVYAIPFQNEPAPDPLILTHVSSPYRSLGVHT